MTNYILRIRSKNMVGHSISIQEYNPLYLLDSLEVEITENDSEEGVYTVMVRTEIFHLCPED